ncbi:MAG: hypothetical protein IMZ50_10440 [Candidatus Atribacteria bacterium]|nr:hypothetical protein [Candidatus Atribacteria bacterium]
MGDTRIERFLFCWWRRLWLFLGIVWRRYDKQTGTITLATAWRVAGIVWTDGREWSEFPETPRA